jgi:hypothetical protein
MVSTGVVEKIATTGTVPEFDLLIANAFSAKQVRDRMPAVWIRQGRSHAYRRVSVFLSMQ